ncbi:unnamed protein product [Calypogeia fissa]
MVPRRPSDEAAGVEGATLRGGATSAFSNLVLRAATALVRSLMFSAHELMELGLEMGPVFCQAAVLCESGGMSASAEVCEDLGLDPLVEPVVSTGVEDTWQAAATRLEDLPARPAIDRARVAPQVVMVDNRSGVFQMVSPAGQVYRPDRILLDSGAQPLMLGKAVCIGLGIRRLEIEPCPFRIQTSLGGASIRPQFMTRERLSVNLFPDHATDSSTMQATAVVTSTESYDVLVGCAVLYPMGFQLDYWTETASFRLGWQSGDGRTVQVPVRFIARPSTRKAPADTLAAVSAFSGVVSWPGELLASNLHAEDTPVYAELEEEEEGMVEPSPPDSRVLTPLDTTPIALEYPPEGICVLDLFGGISTGLATVLQAATRGYQHALPLDISLLGAPDLERVGPVDLVIAGWPCQGHTRVGRGRGLQDPKSGMFYEMLRVLRYLQEFQARPPAYILENVPVLGDTRAQVLASVRQVRVWLGPALLLDAASVGSRAHRPRLWWTNLLPREVLRRAFDAVQRPSDLTVDSILDGGRQC